LKILLTIPPPYMNFLKTHTAKAQSLFVFSVYGKPERLSMASCVIFFPKSVISLYNP